MAKKPRPALQLHHPVPPAAGSAISDRAYSWFQVMNLGGGKAKIEIRGVIGVPKWYEDWGIVDSAAGTFKDFEKEVKNLGDVTEVELSVFSPGGYVWDALAIHDLIARHSAKWTGIVDGLAASAASFLVCACDTVQMPRNSYLMIHNGEMGEWGDHRAMAAAAEKLEKWDGNIADIYAGQIEANLGTARSESLPDIRERMAAETYLDGPEALELGLIDAVLEPVEMAAQLKIPAVQLGAVNFSGMPEPLRALFDIPGATMSTPTEPQNPSNQSPASAGQAEPSTPDPAEPATTPAPAAATNQDDPAEPAEEENAEGAETPGGAEETPAEPRKEETNQGEGTGGTGPETRSTEEEPPQNLADTITQAVNAAVQPINERLENLETFHQTGVKPNAWGNAQPAKNVQTSDPENPEPGGGSPADPIDFEKKSPLQLISLGLSRQQPPPVSAGGNN